MNRFVEACNVGSLDQVNVVCIAEIVYEKMGIGKPNSGLTRQRLTAEDGEAT